MCLLAATTVKAVMDAVAVSRQPTQGGSYASSRMLLAEPAPVAAAVALMVTRLPSPSSTCRWKHRSLQHHGRSSQVCRGGLKAVRLQRGSHASSRVLLAELSPVVAEIALTIVEDMLSQLYVLAAHLSLQHQRSKRSSMQWRLQGSPPSEVFTRLITHAAC